MCKEICKFFATKPTPTKIRYVNGHKRCSHCDCWFSGKWIRCPCCGNLLRTKTKTGKRLEHLRIS